MAVVVVGSVNVDLVVRVDRLPSRAETVIGGTYSRHPGGKGGNQAVAAARFGAAVRFVGAVGGDDFGHAALDDLAAEGIDVSGAATLPDAPTGVALIVVDSGGDNQIAVASGANARLTGEHVDDALRSRLDPDDVVLVGFEIPDDAVVAAARYAREAGARLFVDPAPARDVPEGLMDCRPILLPNAGEAAVLTGEAEPERAARALWSRTGAPVIVTLGEGGAFVVDGGSSGRVDALPADAVDTTGAGDTLAGALVAEAARGAAFLDSLRMAMAAAALSVTVFGAREGMPTRDDAAALLAQAAAVTPPRKGPAAPRQTRRAAPVPPAGGERRR